MSAETVTASVYLPLGMGVAWSSRFHQVRCQLRHWPAVTVTSCRSAWPGCWWVEDQRVCGDGPVVDRVKSASLLLGKLASAFGKAGSRHRSRVNAVGCAGLPL